MATPITGVRKGMILKEGDAKERVVSAGQGIGSQANMKLIEDLAKAAGVAINKSSNAPIFKNCDCGIAGDVNEIMPRVRRAPG